MPPLTWRDTANPDFYTSLGALKQSGDAMNRAFGGASDALGKFNDYSQGQNAAALMANAVKYTNPADLQAAFANGSIMDGVNPGFLTADALKNTQGQVGTLLNNATNQENLNFNQQADPLRVQGLGAFNDQTRSTTAGQLITNTQASNMNPLLLDRQGLMNASLTTANAGADLNLSEAQRNNSDTLAARPLINQLSTAKSPDAVNALLATPEAMALSPGARQQLLQAAQGSPYSDTPGPGGSAGPAGRGIAGAVGGSNGAPAPANGGPGTAYDPIVPGAIARVVAATPSLAGTAGTENGSMYDRSYGNKPTATPLSTQNIGDVAANGHTQEHSPTGAYQITADTLDDFGPKVLGPDWKSQTYTPAIQDAIAEAVFNASKNGNLQARWPSLPDATPGAYANKTWPEMRSIITKGEVGNVDPSGGPNGLGDVNSLVQDAKNRSVAIGSAAYKTSQGLNIGSAQNLANAPEAQIYQPRVVMDKDAHGNLIGQHMGPAPIDDPAPMGEVLNRLTSSSVFQGAPPEWLENTLQQTMKTAHVNAASAAVIMEAHPQAASWLPRHLAWTPFGYNFKPDDAATQAGAQAVANGSSSDTAAAAGISGATSARVTAAATEAQNASQALAAALHDQNMASQIPGLITKRDATEKIFHAINDPVAGKDSMNQVKWNPDGTVIPRHITKPAPAEPGIPLPVAATDTPGPAGSALAAATGNPQAVSPMSGAEAVDPGIQAQRGKVQAALDRLSAAQTRNDPKLGAYKIAANRATQALQDAVSSRRQSQAQQAYLTNTGM